MERTGITVSSRAKRGIYSTVPGPSTRFWNRRTRSLASLGMTATPLDRSRCPSRRLRAVGTRLSQARSARMEPPDVPAGLLHVLLVAERAIRMHQVDQRIGCHRAPRVGGDQVLEIEDRRVVRLEPDVVQRDRKSTRLNSSHSQISYAVFCLKKKKKN